MRKLVGSFALIALVGCLAEAHAGGLFGPYGGYVGGVGFGFSRGRLRVSGGFVGARLYGPVAPWCGPGCGPYFPPWCGPPGFGGVTVVSVAAPPPPFLVLPPPPLPPPEFPQERFEVPAMPRVPDPPPPPPPPREEEKPKKPERGKELPRPPAAKADPEDEYALQLMQGREAFQLLEYGRAAQRFREGASLRNREALPHFLLAQSLIAQGKYHDAHDAILAGLARDPAWPTSGFRPLELYDEAAEYSDHLETLARAVERHPLDPELLFVYAYQLWFDGRTDEASVYFRRAAPGAKDAKAITLFLRALPAGETL